MLSTVLMLAQRVISLDRRAFIFIAGSPMPLTRSKRYPGDVSQSDGSVVCSRRFYIMSSVHFFVRNPLGYGSVVTGLGLRARRMVSVRVQAPCESVIGRFA